MMPPLLLEYINLVRFINNSIQICYLSGVYISHMELDEWDFDAQESISDRDGGVGEAAGIQDDAVGSICPCFLNLVDDSALPVTTSPYVVSELPKVVLLLPDWEAMTVPLEELDVRIERLRLFLPRIFHISKRLVPVKLRLTSAKEIKIGSVDDQNRLLSVTHGGDAGLK